LKGRAACPAFCVSARRRDLDRQASAGQRESPTGGAAPHVVRGGDGGAQPLGPFGRAIGQMPRQRVGQGMVIAACKLHELLYRQALHAGFGQVRSTSGFPGVHPRFDRKGFNLHGRQQGVGYAMTGPIIKPFPELENDCDAKGCTCKRRCASHILAQIWRRSSRFRRPDGDERAGCAAAGAAVTQICAG